MLQKVVNTIKVIGIIGVVGCAIVLFFTDNPHKGLYIAMLLYFLFVPTHLIACQKLKHIEEDNRVSSEEKE